MPPEDSDLIFELAGSRAGRINAEALA